MCAGLTLGAYSLSVLRLGAVVFPMGLTATRLRVYYLAQFSGPVARLAEIVSTLSLLLVVAIVLGITALLTINGLIASSITVSLVAFLIMRRTVPGVSHVVRTTGGLVRARVTPRWGLIAVAGAVALVVAQWLIAAQTALNAGMYNIDTLWYHMPFAAGFAQTGSILHLHYTQADPLIAFYPANSELLHAIGILAFKSDALSPCINLGWLGVALLAGWCIGRPWGLGPVGLCAVCVVAAVPVIANSQPGQATNDFAALAMLLAAIAFLTNSAGDRRAIVLASLAAGFAAGTKTSFALPAVLVVGVGLFFTEGRRTSLLAVCLTALLVTGGYWYIRNAVASGNPTGVAHFGIGPVSLPAAVSPYEQAIHDSLLGHIGDPELLWRRIDRVLAPFWGWDPSGGLYS